MTQPSEPDGGEQVKCGALDRRVANPAGECNGALGHLRCFRTWYNVPGAALTGDRDGLIPAAAALAAAGCRYQWARTLVHIGGAERARGESELAAMGATAMAVPPE